MSGTLLLSELLARGIVARTSKESPTGYFRREKDPVDDLCAKLVLVPRYDQYSRYRYSYGYHREYPDLALLAALRTVIEAAAPLSWSSSGQSPGATSTGERTPGEVIFDLAPHRSGSWATGKLGYRSGRLPNQEQPEPASQTHPSTGPRYAGPSRSGVAALRTVPRRAS